MSSSFEFENFIISVAQTGPIGKSKSFIYAMDTSGTGRKGARDLEQTLGNADAYPKINHEQRCIKT